MLITKKTILLIDDDPAILRVFSVVLEKNGYSVVTVETGKAAIEQINHRRFDVALIDVRLPDMDGTELLPIIQVASPKTVKIVLTGTPNAELMANTQNRCMDVFLIKPVRPDALLNILNDKLKAK